MRARMAVSRHALALCLVVANCLEDECSSSECSHGQLHDSNFLQMRVSLDAAAGHNESGIFDTINSIGSAVSDKVEEVKEKISPVVDTISSVFHKDGKSASRLSELVVDGRNLTQLLKDLHSTNVDMERAEALAKDFEKCLIRVEIARKQVNTAKEAKETSMEAIHKLLGITITQEMVLDESLPIEEALHINSSLMQPAKIAAETAVKAAELTKAVQDADHAIISGGHAFKEAMTEQTKLVDEIQALLRVSILREMNDTRLVQVLDASDRIDGTVTVTTSSSTAAPRPIIVIVANASSTSTTTPTPKPTTTATTARTKLKVTTTQAATSTPASSETLGLYPSDWAVIGSLILLGVLVALITIYSRTVAA